MKRKPSCLIAYSTVDADLLNMVIVASPRCASLRLMMPNAIKDGPRDISSLLSLAKYERAHEYDDYAQRRAFRTCAPARSSSEDIVTGAGHL